MFSASDISTLKAINSATTFSSYAPTKAFHGYCVKRESQKLQKSSDILYTVIYNDIERDMSIIMKNLASAIESANSVHDMTTQLWTYYAVFWRERRLDSNARHHQELADLPQEYHDEYLDCIDTIRKRIIKDGLDTKIRVTGQSNPSDWYGYRNGEDASHYRYVKLENARVDRIVFATDICERLNLAFGTQYRVRVDRTVYDESHPDFRVFKCDFMLDFCPNALSLKETHKLIRVFEKYRDYTPYALGEDDRAEINWGNNPGKTPIPTTQAIVIKARAAANSFPIIRTLLPESDSDTDSISTSSSTSESDDISYFLREDKEETSSEDSTTFCGEEDSYEEEDNIEGYTMSSVFANRD